MGYEQEKPETRTTRLVELLFNKRKKNKINGIIWDTDNELQFRTNYFFLTKGDCFENRSGIRTGKARNENDKACGIIVQ